MTRRLYAQTLCQAPGQTGLAIEQRIYQPAHERGNRVLIFGLTGLTHEMEKSRCI